jgi:putative ABC transport system permease protein
MYPNLMPTLAVLLGVAIVVAVYISLRRPFLRKLALRQLARRRREAMLVVAGSVLGTAIIVGSLVVGDTLNFSVKQVAYTSLGPTDEWSRASGLRRATRRRAGSSGCARTPTSTGC